ncbi:hypothetical protein OIU84_021036 [Salix udensis]|uniref:Uncharacterized protein n=1 Tax=Salix udensis TaxID=889485 RepID=A0AAD6PH10_9ROSI|nr:hypothetical protein OIU84_021036 [Salix udensis]
MVVKFFHLLNLRSSYNSPVRNPGHQEEQGRAPFDEVVTPKFTSNGSGVKKAIIPKWKSIPNPKTVGSKLP